MTPTSRLTPELREGLRANRAALLALLEQRAPDVGPEHNTIPRLPWQLERFVNAASSRLLPDGAVQLTDGLTNDLNRYVLAWSAAYLTGDGEYCLHWLWAAYHAWQPEEVN